MEWYLDFTFSSINLLMMILTYSVIIYFARRLYIRKTERPKVWKIVLVLYVGLFAFSINWSFSGTMARIPVLPLGVWILYFALKGKNNRWQTYRSYAWLGFWANFLFLASSLIAIPIHQVVYPEKEITTYLASVENPSIVSIHPSAKQMKLNKETLLTQLDRMKKETVYSIKWYEDTFVEFETNKRNEQFPYQLIGTSTKWGSGISTIIYVEEDGKGILIDTPKKQVYFRSDQPLLEAVK